MVHGVDNVSAICAGFKGKVVLMEIFTEAVE
jgi:hypothetical protein